MIYLRNQMVDPWNEEIISLAIFNFGKKKKKENKKKTNKKQQQNNNNISAVTLKGGSEAVYSTCQTRNPRRSRVTRTGHLGWICSRLSRVQILGHTCRIHPF